ncbi:hypothetical protein G7Y89_g15451 [Cudoniella acicularis]|uniref:Uncharacterized protein n=1 Tax=Cudoniella acicularis TaxID=354080 RepID=A0A8H4VJR2_9HELO|nr:hypothetical protein G7Y89_g15451 [Cudoniella acicularis]
MAYSQDDDFEIIDAQSPPATGLHVVSMAEAELPIRQKKVSPDEEETTERAIKPLVSLMQETTKLQEKSGPIFQRAAIEKDGSSSHVRDNIFEAFVTGLPVEEQQMMNCNACKKFMSQYGDLCTVGEDGSLLPLMWPTDTEKVPQYYRKSVEHVLTLLETSGGTVGDEFAIQDKAGRVLGVPKTGAWSHMSITLTEIRITRANDPMKSQDTTTSHNMLNAILERNPAGVVERAHHYLGQNLLPYAESHKSAIIYLQNTVASLL